MKRPVLRVRTQYGTGSPEMLESIELYRNGAGITILAENLGISYTAMRNRLMRDGVKLRDKGRIPNTFPQGKSRGAYNRNAKKLLRRSGRQTSKCECCGSRERIDIHHKDRDWTNNTLDNLQVVCHTCHMRIHTQ